MSIIDSCVSMNAHGFAWNSESIKIAGVIIRTPRACNQNTTANQYVRRWAFVTEFASIQNTSAYADLRMHAL